MVMCIDGSRCCDRTSRPERELRIGTSCRASWCIAPQPVTPSECKLVARRRWLPLAVLPSWGVRPLDRRLCAPRFRWGLPFQRCGSYALPPANRGCGNHPSHLLQRDRHASSVRFATASRSNTAVWRSTLRMDCPGRPGSVPGTRERGRGEDTPCLPYRGRGQVVEILRVVDTSRRLPPHGEVKRIDLVRPLLKQGCRSFGRSP